MAPIIYHHLQTLTDVFLLDPTHSYFSIASVRTAAGELAIQNDLQFHFGQPINVAQVLILREWTI